LYYCIVALPAVRVDEEWLEYEVIEMESFER